MNVDAWNRWLMLAANIGVIGGFALVAIQLHENTAATQAQYATTFSQTALAGELACMGDSLAEAMSTAILAPEKLSDAQIYQIWCYLDIGLFAAKDTWDKYAEGRASRETWSFAKGALVTYFDFDVGRAIWPHIRGNADFPPDAIAEIEDAMAKGQGRAFRQFSGMVGDVRKMSDNRGAQPSPENAAGAVRIDAAVNSP
jgi:hypothetical protein